MPCWAEVWGHDVHLVGAALLAVPHFPVTMVMSASAATVLRLAVSALSDSTRVIRMAEKEQALPWKIVLPSEKKEEESAA